MQIRKRLKTAKPENDFEQKLVEELQSAWFELANTVNNGLKFTDNFDSQIIDVADTGVANTEFTVAHTIKRIPIGFIVFNTNKGGVVYTSSTTWTVTDIYLKCASAHATLKIMVF